MLNIIKRQIARNFTDGNFTKKYIVIHETDNERAGADADAHFRNWNNNKSGASAHFVVDDKCAIQMMDLVDRAWAVGVIYGNPRNNPDATNENTINIEICVNSDGNYLQARQNAIELVKILMPQTGIGADCVIRHYDACKKWCPRRMLDNPTLWADFKAQIVAPTESVKIVAPTPVYKLELDGTYTVADLQVALNMLGFKGSNMKALTVDGKNGPNTQYALKTFQRVMGLEVDGIAGSMTWGAIEQIVNKPTDGVPYPHYEYATRYICHKVGCPVSGSFDNRVKQFVIAWQSKVGLSQDGVVGPKTWAKLIG